MSSETVPSSLRNLLADTFGVAPEEVTPEMSSTSTEGWDSFAHLQAILAIESEYGVQFDPQRIPELTSVAKMQQALEQKGVVL